jgi:uncharacterized RDD family membrane protein YckC
MPLTRLGEWVIDGLEARAGVRTSVSPLLVAVFSLIALGAGLLAAGIALGPYIVLGVVTLLVFLALYVGYRALRFGYRRTMA